MAPACGVAVEAGNTRVEVLCWPVLPDPLKLQVVYLLVSPVILAV